MIEKRTIGLNFIAADKANLIVWSPLAHKVFVEIKGHKHELKEESMGFWELQKIEIQPGQSYDIIVDGRSYPDPASLWQPDGLNGSSRAFDLHNYTWNDAAWNGIALEDMILYELHIGTFTPEGTLEAASHKIEYLKDLGVNAIEIMPVAQFPGPRNWGYDGVFPFTVQHSYGGPEALQKFVDHCHQNGLAVVMDVVYNHLGPEGNILPAFGPVFTDKYKTPWGQAVNFDDAWSDGIRMYYIENALMWLRDFHIDGLRLDAVHAIKDFGAKHILQEIQEHVAALNIRTNKKHVLIIESDLNDVKYITAPEKGGYGMDATWSDEFHHALHALLTKERRGYYEDFGDVNALEKAYNYAFVNNGNWSEHRKKRFGNKTNDVPGHKFVVFSQNHDQVGNRMLGDRLSTLVDFEALKLVAGAVLFSPFIPLLFMGEEYAETTPFLYFTSHTGHELIRQVRMGRAKEFEAFMNAKDMPDPQEVSSFLQSKLNWDNRSELQMKMLAFYKELIRLRKTHPIWRSTDRSTFNARVLEQRNVLMLTRKNRDQLLFAILNFEETPYLLPIGDNTTNLRIILNSGDTQWGGPVTGIDSQNLMMSVAPRSICVFENVPQ